MMKKGKLFLHAFQQWQKEWCEKLMKRLMNGEIPQHVPISADVVSSEDRQSFLLRRVIYQSQPDRKNELLLALPANPSGPVPLEGLAEFRKDMDEQSAWSDRFLKK